MSQLNALANGALMPSAFFFTIRDAYRQADGGLPELNGAIRLYFVGISTFTRYDRQSTSGCVRYRPTLQSRDLTQLS